MKSTDLSEPPFGRDRRCRWLALALILPLVAIAAAAAAAPGAPDLMRWVSRAPADTLSGVDAWLVDVDTSLLARGAGSMRLQLPDGREVTAVREGFERRSPGDVMWWGHLESESSSRVVVTLKNGWAVGRIVSSHGLYMLRPVPGDVHRMEKLDPARFAPCATTDAEVRGERSESFGPEPAEIDPADRIDVMSLYTPQARNAAGGDAQIAATIQAAVDNANLAFTDSLMVPRLNLVHTELANHNDTGNLSTDLSWLINDPTAAASRDAHAADMVSLIVENGGGNCGIGYVMRNPGPGFERYAFQVTDRGCAVGNLSYAHEHGHNMGFEHDPAYGPSPSSASYPWSFGHFVNGSYRTVMSYSNQCSQGCSRVPHFSNPDVLYAGVPTGIANERDNARTGDLTAPIVTDFRISGECGNQMMEPGEECDGADLGSATCADVGCTGGAPTCAADCTLDYSGCTGCSLCDNDGECDAGEDCNNCPNDCISGGGGATCGNGVCEAGDGEDCVSCPSDCRGKQGGKRSSRYCCGDGEGENPRPCSDPICTSGEWQCTDIPAKGYCCGDLRCGGIEDSCACAIDCGMPSATEWNCSDGQDEDCDGLTDCDDPDCVGDQACVCEQVGRSCTQNSDCCSNKCRGRKASKTCQ